MGVGEFIIFLSLICGGYLIADKTLKLIKWKMEYDITTKKDLEEIDEFIKEGDLK